MASWRVRLKRCGRHNEDPTSQPLYFTALALVLVVISVALVVAVVLLTQTP